MGRVGEVIIRTWQTADKMKRQRGACRGNRRQRQFPRPPLHRQIHHQPGHRPRHVQGDRLHRGRQARRSGAVEPGLLRRQAGHGADRRRHRRRADGRSERLDPDAAAGALPLHVRRLRQGAHQFLGDVFTSEAAIEDGLCTSSAPTRNGRVENTRGGISKAVMVLNDATPDIEVDPETYEVRADGELLTCEPATELPMAQRYFLFVLRLR
jgi:urease subunit alpha